MVETLTTLLVVTPWLAVCALAVACRRPRGHRPTGPCQLHATAAQCQAAEHAPPTRRPPVGGSGQARADTPCCHRRCAPTCRRQAVPR